VSEIEVVEAEEIQRLPAVRAHEAMVTRAEVSVDEVVAQRNKIRDVMSRVMEEGVHYGRIPGVQKPTLLKPGAEVLNVTFRFAPSYQSEKIFGDDGHLTVVAKCVLTHAPSGMVLGEGEGLCSTRESRYAYRNAGRVCPACGTEAIIKGKEQYGGGWVCFKKKGGCGAKFEDGDPTIEEQQVGKVANPDVPDAWNTILKMADKRALVAAILNCTAASDIFTQDVEDLGPMAAEPTGQRPAATSPRLVGSWAEWTEAMAGRGVPADDSSAWLRQASDGLDVSDEKGRTDLFRRANLVLAALTELGRDLLLAEDARERIREAFAAAFDGVAPDGPEWRLSPAEQDRPTREEHARLAATAERLAETEQAEAEAIPFGE
jgi:hypothetical protein